ncbi:MAG: PorT family protein [Bacteroidetes bacterium]|nr:PorT family protein [Bacteroidota bacterium]
MRILRLKFIVFFIAVVAFFINDVNGQRFLGAVALGGNLSRLNGDEADAGLTYNKLGMNVAAAVILPFGKNWDLTLETSFSQKGSRQGENPGNDYPWKYNLRLNYVEVPLLVHYIDKNIIRAGLGMSWGRLVSYKEVEDDGNLTPYTDVKKFADNDFSAVADVMIRLFHKFHLNLRYSRSVVPIRTRQFTYIPTSPPDPNAPGVTRVWERDQFNSVITLRLVYIINENLSERE